MFSKLTFKSQQQALSAHLISRIIYTGAGSLLEDHNFILSEKSLAVNCLRRRSIHRNDKPIFDCGNLIKDYELAVWEVFLLRFSGWTQLIKSKQRLQIAFSDSNRCHLAEFLKIGVTGLLVRMANDGLLTEAPRFHSGIRALQQISRDSTLKCQIFCTKGDPYTALEIQRWYLNQAKSYLKMQKINLEDREVVRLWESTLDSLEERPESLVGRVDWVTKKYLMQQNAGELGYWALKKIDLKYHELGTGYFESLQSQGLTTDFFNASEIDHAVFHPSSPDRVKMRSRLITSNSFEGKQVTVSWSQAKIGTWNAKIISLGDYRPKDQKVQSE